MILAELGREALWSPAVLAYSKAPSRLAICLENEGKVDQFAARVTALTGGTERTQHEF